MEKTVKKFEEYGTGSLSAQVAAEILKVKQNLHKVEAGIEALESQFLNDSGNWGFFGSVAHVNEELEDILEFLGNQ